MPLSPISIFALVSVLSLAGVALILTNKWWNLKRLKLSFPDIGESSLSIFLKRRFGNGKLEKQALFFWKEFESAVFRAFEYLKKSGIVEKVKGRIDRMLGKSGIIPDRETSSVFLKSISEHKKKARVEKEEQKENRPAD